LTDFDTIIDRRGTNSIKWKKYPEDVLPMWVADMDFAVPEPIRAVLRAKVEHGIYGYEAPSSALLQTVAARIQRLYNWQVTPEMILATPGVVAGFNAAAKSACTAREGVVIQPPVYPPFYDAHKYWGLVHQEAPLTVRPGEAHLHYEVDFDAFKAAFGSGGAKTGIFLMCNPHNPTGQVYSRSEMTRMAEIALEKKAVIVSDEIHSELLLGKTEFSPIAALSPEVAEQTITLVAPSKTFNVPGLFCGFAIIPNKELRERYKRTLESLTMHVSSFGLAAAETAYSGMCDEWLKELRNYLTANRDFLVEFVHNELAELRTTVPDATYLAWVDCSEAVRTGLIEGTPQEFFLQKARVGLNEGCYFGQGYENFIRLNFGCPRQVLMEGLEKMKAALGL
jgi:cysteine-S-conjugate beta-lyase